MNFIMFSKKQVKLSLTNGLVNKAGGQYAPEIPVSVVLNPVRDPARTYSSQVKAEVSTPEDLQKALYRVCG